MSTIRLIRTWLRFCIRLSCLLPCRCWLAAFVLLLLVHCCCWFVAVLAAADGDADDQCDEVLVVVVALVVFAVVVLYVARTTERVTLQTLPKTQGRKRTRGPNGVNEDRSQCRAPPTLSRLKARTGHTHALPPTRAARQPTFAHQCLKTQSRRRVSATHKHEHTHTHTHTRIYTHAHKHKHTTHTHTYTKIHTYMHTDRHA